MVKSSVTVKEHGELLRKFMRRGRMSSHTLSKSQFFASGKPKRMKLSKQEIEIRKIKMALSRKKRQYTLRDRLMMVKHAYSSLSDFS